VSNRFSRSGAEPNDMSSQAEIPGSVERLLDGSDEMRTPLARLLAAARYVPSDADPAGLSAAMAAFTQANPTGNTRISKDAGRLGHPLTRLSGKLIAVVTAVTVAAGGVAVAASTGHISNPLTSNPTEAPSRSTAAASNSSVHPAPRAPGRASAPESSNPVPTTASGGPSTTGTGISSAEASATTAAASPSKVKNEKPEKTVGPDVTKTKQNSKKPSAVNGGASAD
jgi:hypothetical protein